MVVQIKQFFVVINMVLHIMNVFTIAAAQILKTRKKRPTVGTKSGRSLIYQLGKQRPNFTT